MQYEKADVTLSMPCTRPSDSLGTLGNLGPRAAPKGQGFVSICSGSGEQHLSWVASELAASSFPDQNGAEGFTAGLHLHSQAQYKTLSTAQQVNFICLGALKDPCSLLTASAGFNFPSSTSRGRGSVRSRECAK